MGVRFRKDRNKWIVDLVVNGKRVSKMFDTEADACQYEISLKSKDTKAISGEVNSLKLAIRKYYDDVSINKSSTKQEKYYFQAFFKYFQSINISRVELITLSHLEGFRGYLNKRKIKKNSVNRYFITIRHFFNYCVDMGILKESPASKFKMYEVNKYQITRRLWSDDQIVDVISKADGWLKDFITIVAHTGMRPIEVCRLTWSDHVDLNKGMIKAISFKGRGKMLDRWIPLYGDLKLSLKKRKLAVNSKYVFPDSSGAKPKTSDSVGQQFKDLVRGTELDGYTMYGMRHSFATRSLESGVDINSIRMLMGHTTLSTTQIYLRYTEDHLRDAVSLLESKRNLTATKSATNMQP